MNNKYKESLKRLTKDICVDEIDLTFDKDVKMLEQCIDNYYWLKSIITRKFIQSLDSDDVIKLLTLMVEDMNDESKLRFAELALK